MSIELRKTGIGVVGDVPWGTHLCHFYETKQDLLDTLVPYFKAGLESKEFCLWVVSSSELVTVEEAREALEQAVPDLDRHLSDESIEILNGLDWYLEENGFNLERVTSAWDAKLKRALALGYQGMRVSGDTIWLSEKGWRDFCAYEKQLNDLISDRPMTVLCTYPLWKSGAAEILDVVQVHQFASARRQGEWEVIETRELRQAKAEIKRLNADLERRVIERTSELRVMNEQLSNEITDRIQIDRRLRESQQQFESLVHSIDGIVWEFDAETFTFTFVSKQAERILGYPLSRWFEPNFWKDHVHPDDLELAVGFGVDAAEERVDHRLEYRMIAVDGREVWLRDHVTVPIRKDESVFLRGVMLDITERKRAEEALNDSRRYLQALFDNSLDAILVTNKESRYIDANPAACALLGYTHEELMRLSVIDLTAEPFRQAGWAMWQEFLTRGSQSGEYSTLRKDGTVLQLEFRAVANVLPNVHVSACRDITERKQADEKLKSTSDQLRALSVRLQATREEEGTRIAREIHDELGAALTSLRWDLEDVDEAISEMEDRPQLQETRKKIEAMMRLTDTTINTVRRIASELRPSVLDALGLNEAIEWQARQFQDRTGITVQCDCALENVNLSHEQSTALFRIFQEALTNILRHAQATAVKVEIKAEDGDFILTIADNGRGITADEKSDQRTLGLLGMRERAHLIGGNIDITGFDGKGTVVTVRLPNPG